MDWSYGINSIDADTLMTSPMKKSRFIVEGLLPHGVNLICGSAKAGKSWLMLDLALHVAQGLPMWGFETHQCDVLYLSLEDTYSRIQDRLFKLSEAAPENLRFAVTCGQIGGGLEHDIDSYLYTYPQTGLIIIDTLQKVRGVKDKSSGGIYANDYDDISALKKVADERNVAIILVHHLRKTADSSDPFNQISGTTGILGAVDTSYILKREGRSSSGAMLLVTGRDVDYQQLTLQFEDMHWSLLEHKGSEDLRAEEIPQFIFRLADFIGEKKQWCGNATDLLAELSDTDASPNIVTRSIARYYYDVLFPRNVFFKTKRTGKAREIILWSGDGNDGSDGN